MWRRFILILCTILMIIASCIVDRNRSEKIMAINFKGASDGFLSFPVGTLQNYDTKSIGGWVYVNSFLEGDGNEYMIQSIKSDLSLTGFSFRIGENSHKVYYFQDFDEGHGSCYVLASSTNAVISAPGLYHIMITWDRNYLHTAVLYINGVPVPVTQVDSSGNPGCDLGGGHELDDSTVSLILGSPYTSSATADAIDGWMSDWRIYNRELSSSEVYEIFKMRGDDNLLKGLVFRAKLDGAAGIQNFKGAVLAGTNYVKDSIVGAVGTPNNSIEGVEDIIMGGK